MTSPDPQFRIAMVCRYLPSDSKMGVGYQVHALSNQLAARGHSLTVLAESPKPSDALYNHQSFNVSGSLRSLKASWKMRSSIDWSSYDILHAHGDDWFLWNKQVPAHVRTMHGSCLAEARHIPTLKGKLQMLWLAALETLSCRIADRVIGVSINTTKSYPWIRRVIPNGVDINRFKAGTKSFQPTILFVGTYHNRKRGKWLVEQFQKSILPRVPSAVLQMVCDAPEAPGVQVFGKVSPSRLEELYRKAWVFCLPSTYEGFGVPYIEAMASGTSVVTTHNPGSDEVLSEGKWGLLCEDNQLADSIVDVLTNSELRQNLESLGLRRSKDFAWDKIVSQYESVYEELLKTKYGT